MTIEQIEKVVKDNGFKVRGNNNEYCLLFRSMNNQDIYLDINIEPDEEENFTHEVHLYNGVTDEVIFSKFMSESDFSNSLNSILKGVK